MAVCKKKSVEPTTPDMKEMMLEMTNAERQYCQNLEVGEAVSMLLNSNEKLSEESLTDKYKKALKLYRESQVRHVPAYQHATLKPWQKEVAYDMLKGIKDGHKVSAKYDSRGLFFKTPNTVMVFSNEFPMVEPLKKDRWRIYEIIGEYLYNKTLSATKPKRRLIGGNKNYTIYGDWGCEYMRNGVDRQFLHEQNSY